MADFTEDTLQPEAASSVAKDGKTPRYAWVIWAVTYLASLSAPLGQFKVTTLASWLIPAYGLDYAQFGLLMSCLAIIGALLAFPAAFICRRFGLKATTLAAVACVALGGIIELSNVGPSGIMLLYGGRFLEGVGIGLIGVSAPTIISLWFPEKTRGVALGAWCTWVPFSIFLVFNTAPAIAATSAWQNVFVAVIVYAIIVGVLFAIFFKLPGGSDADYAIEGTFKDCFKYLKNKYIWILGITFIVYNFCQGGVINTYYNSFLETNWGFSAAEAAFMTSVITIIGFPMNPIAGYVSGRLAVSRKRFVLVVYSLLYIICFCICFTTSSIALIWIFIVLMGFAAALGGGGSRPLAPTIMAGSAMSATMGMAVMQFTQCIGTMISPAFGALLDTGGLLGMTPWITATVFTCLPLSALALVLSFFIRPDKMKKDAAGRPINDYDADGNQIKVLTSK